MCLLLDKCSSHSINLKLRAIELVFLQLNTTSIIQSIDCRIIRNFKLYYHKQILIRFIAQIDAEQGETNTSASKVTMFC